MCVCMCVCVCMYTHIHAVLPAGDDSTLNGVTDDHVDGVHDVIVASHNTNDDDDGDDEDSETDEFCDTLDSPTQSVSRDVHILVLDIPYRTKQNCT